MSLLRRQFLSTAAAGTVALVAAPAIHAQGKTDNPLIVGEGEHKFEVQHEWPHGSSQYGVDEDRRMGRSLMEDVFLNGGSCCVDRPSGGFARVLGASS